VLQQQEVHAAHDAGDLRCVALPPAGWSWGCLGTPPSSWRRAAPGAAAAQGQRLHGEDRRRTSCVTGSPMICPLASRGDVRHRAHRVAPQAGPVLGAGAQVAGSAVEALPFKVVCSGLDSYEGRV